MTRIWQFSRPSNGSHPASPIPSPPMPPLDLEPEERPERYLVRPVRPVAQMAARVALWGAVTIGCIGGILAFVRPAESEPQPVQTDGAGAVVPAPVAGTAERVVREWLTATEADQELLEQLFVEVPPIGNPGTYELEVRDATTVAGRRLADGYWSVTVAADVVDAPPERNSQAEEVEAAAGGDPEEEVSREGTWYLEVGIVGDVEGGLLALAAPAVVSQLPEAAPGWAVGEAQHGDAIDGDPIVATVQGFLTAMLTGDGDPERYAAPGVEVQAASPAPFVEVEVQDVAMDEMEDGRTWVLAQVLGTTRGGVTQVFTYDLMVQQRVDRWEVDTLSGVPTVVREATPSEPAPESEPEADPATEGEGDGGS